MARTYVVTGAASGIGQALFNRLKEEGNTVIGVDIHNADVNVDLSKPEGRAEMVAQVTEKSGGVVDGVAAVAGLGNPSVALVAVNYFGMVDSLVGLRPLLAESSAPRAALVSSFAATHAVIPDLLAELRAGEEEAALKRAAQILADPEDDPHSLYSTTKYAIALWARENSVTDAWAGSSIALNAIGPGTIKTPMLAKSLETPGRLEVLKALAPAPYGGPLADPSAPAGLLRYLISEENTFLTGQIIFIDGGADAIHRPESI